MTFGEITEANRASWNAIAHRRSGLPVEHFREGHGSLADFEIDLAGDVRGKRVLQLACSYGDEVLSWANLGASAIGADISDVAIQTARRRAAEAGIAADFRRADMFALPGDLVDLDLIYLSWGALCWAPDAGALARIIASRLRPGGRLLLCEHHPVWEVLAVAGEGHLAPAGDYFGRGRPNADQDAAKRPTGAEEETLSAYVWPVGDVFTALTAAGLRVDTFFEAPEPALYAGLGAAASRLPAYYVIRASLR